MRAVWLSPSPAGLPSTFPAGVPEVSRFSCTKLPGVSGVYDYAGLTADSRLRLRSCCLPLNPQRRRPDCNFSKLDTQPTCTSVYASPGTSRHLTQNSRPSGSLPLSRKTLPFSASCRFIPAHEFPFWTTVQGLLVVEGQVKEPQGRYRNGQGGLAGRQVGETASNSTRNEASRADTVTEVVCALVPRRIPAMSKSVPRAIGPPGSTDGVAVPSRSAFPGVRRLQRFRRAHSSSDSRKAAHAMP